MVNLREVKGCGKVYGREDNLEHRHERALPWTEHGCDECHALLIRAMIYNPEVESFLTGVLIEVEHQKDRWKDSDPMKSDADWYWLIGWLGGKAVMDPHPPEDPRTPKERRLHRIIAVAAAACNWHEAVKRGQ